MREFLNQIRLQAQMSQGDRAATRIGIVSGYDPGNYSCKVRIQPEDMETGWLPILSPWVGNGWGMFAPPTIGDQVDVHFQEAGFEAGFVSLRFYSDSDRPLSVVPGELWLVHRSGSHLKLLNNGDVEVNTAGSLIANVAKDLTATVSQDVNVTASGTATIKAPSIILKSLGVTVKKLCTEVFMSLYNTHTHPDSHGGNTGTPNQQASVGVHTTNIVKAE